MVSRPIQAQKHNPKNLKLDMRDGNPKIGYPVGSILDVLWTGKRGGTVKATVIRRFRNGDHLIVILEAADLEHPRGCICRVKGWQICHGSWQPEKLASVKDLG